jgi:hypothetical protein
VNFGQLIGTFFHDGKVEAALVVVALDFVFGVLAAFKLKTFRLSYVADFGRNDILFKLVPYFVLYSAALVAGGQDILIPGIDLGVVAGAAYVGFMAAWVASVLSSLQDLGIAPAIGGVTDAEQ